MLKLTKELSASVGSITIDAMGNIVSFDPVSEGIFGYLESDVVGRNVCMLMPKPYAMEHDQYLYRYLSGCSPKVIGRGREVRGMRMDGDTFPMWLAVSRVNFEDKVFFVGSVMDLSNQKQVEGDLADSLETTNVILNTAVNPIITISSLGVVESFNPAAETLFGFAANEVMGSNVSMLMPEPYRSEHDQYLVRYLSEGAPKVIGKGREVEGRRKDGSTFPMHLSVGRMTVKGNTTFVGIITDLTELKAAEGGARAKAAFIANTSHEIRTPMNAIIGYSEELLRENGLSDVARDYAQTILNASKELLEVLDDVLDVSKLESGQMAFERRAFSLPQLLENLLKVFSIRARERGIELVLQYAEEVPHFLYGDPLRIRQIFSNLIGNAIKFTEGGFVRIDVMNGAKESERHVVIVDSGVGIALERQKAIFDPFVQADDSTSRKFGGTGLGLNLCKQMITKMGGSIWVRSAPGAGSEFHCLLSMPTAQASDIEQSIEEKSEYIAPSQAYSILLAEDIDTNAKLICMRLERFGHQVTRVCNGLEAVRAFKRHRYDIILMDVMMPEMDGIEASKTIREFEARKAISTPTPIVALTADVMLSDQARYKEAGMDGFAPKPLEFDQLMQQIDALIAHAGDADRLRSQGVAVYASSDVKSVSYTGELLVLAEVVDVVKALDIWQDESAYKSALQEFVNGKQSEFDGFLKQLKTETEDYDPLRFFLHALEGVCANLSVREIPMLCRKLRNALKQAQADQIAVHSQALETQFNKLLLTLNALFEAPALPAQENKDNLNVEGSIQENMAALQEALGTYNPDQIQPCLDALETQLGRESLATVTQYVNRFQYKKASVALLELHEHWLSQQQKDAS